MAKGMDKRKRDEKKPKAVKPKVIAAAPSTKDKVAKSFQSCMNLNDFSFSDFKLKVYFEINSLRVFIPFKMMNEIPSYLQIKK